MCQDGAGLWVQQLVALSNIDQRKKKACRDNITLVEKSFFHPIAGKFCKITRKIDSDCTCCCLITEVVANQ